MTRKKVNLGYISNDAARKITYRKRKKGLSKKVSELTTLCGIEACTVVFSPYESRPEVWPNQNGAHQVITRYQNEPVIDQRKNLNQESYVRQGITKVSDQLQKQLKENREKDMTIAMFQCVEGKSLDDMTMADLNDLDNHIEKSINEVLMLFTISQFALSNTNVILFLGISYRTRTMRS
ncbi:agamous-like MADS-box protein AGL80 [Senna tora]|uniref:Agamous-like MADS-box protein AGL80 n=1 Tax=Senna tora TaxID=362788 RepID=A0A834WC95_9FABA|nr:agamous-like MADS-box protein AGL80 [Senna tora]